ncbi:WLM-domain-containing protein [Annulohypoxylon maeteangense]|uniref:WLM-domain-containing protein n=1 Tax=Annulohypoxylon maeteangense TaxID=1927788 RepID=UPI002008D921|nr:WLM-domain-containing protein [Annulohypoxylon maeteangense]KAI0884653.1 WLM-domain-containing protein [Annulohypoxylon maeteangense]
MAEHTEHAEHADHDMAEQDELPSESEGITITFTHHGKPHSLIVSPDASISDLASSIESTLFIPITNQKLMVSKLGLLKPPFPEHSVSELQDKKITLLGTSNAELASLASAGQQAAQRHAHLASARRTLPKAYTTRPNSQRAREESEYTFGTIRPLSHLPNPQRSQQFLERLSRDPGIRATMIKHKFRVGTLTEMDPLSYTEATHEGTTRILGLNRNKGEVIELRLRTDAYDGYRDYKTIRRTLCHELTHNVHSDHDRLFWDLCKVIEKEVERADYASGGRSVGGAEYAGSRGEEMEEVAYDHGGWTGGEFVLGSGNGGGGASAAGQGALGRREAMAKAAEDRIKKQKRPDDEASGQ